MKKSILSRDRNLWHLSHKGDILEDPENQPKDMYLMSVTLKMRPINVCKSLIQAPKIRPRVFLISGHFLTVLVGNHGTGRFGRKGKASGACQLVVKDLQEESVRDYVFPYALVQSKKGSTC
ncbi:hypothetical protein POM88_033547 [Heracleum sosnowskyi]|uniref:Uncharacterized protein n=1 Tax=Heracleum sosnowskyi TaxID=360622 RepID=A0AAD8I2M2_9APIA|nr:hypothetical protein POM88_033547 [Heracleum sosnowskyi]